MKRKNISITLALALTISTLGSMVAIPKAYALENNNNNNIEIQNNDTISIEQINKFDKFVLFNENKRIYEIDNIAKDKLNSTEYQQLNKSINNTNNFLGTIDFNTNDLVEVVDANNNYLYKNNKIINNNNNYYSTALLAKKKSFKEGVNKVVTYWWGADIYIKKSTINLAGGGVSIAGIWLPDPFISKVVATVGVAVGFAPGGIAFRYNYARGGISSAIGLPGGSANGITKVWWQ